MIFLLQNDEGHIKQNVTDKLIICSMKALNCCFSTDGGEYVPEFELEALRRKSTSLRTSHLQRT